MNLSNSIFCTYEELENENKLTYTVVYDSIPDHSNLVSIEGWEKKYLVEWRWRFLQFNDRKVVEISYQNKNKERYYMNKYGEWVKRNISNIYDKLVIEEYYYYTI